MRYRIHHIDNAPRDLVEKHVRAKSGYIESRLATFQEDLVRLDVRLDHHRKQYADRKNAAAYTGHLVLDLPGRRLPNIAADGHGANWTTAINEAFDDLEDQLGKILADLHRETAVHDYQHRPSWEREGAERLGRPQIEPEDPDRWMEEWEQDPRT